MAWELVRKFGLEHCDLPTMIWNVGMFLRLLALNIDRRYKAIPIFIYLWVVLSFLCLFYIYSFCVVWFIFWYFPQQGDDILSAIIVLSCGILCWCSTNKLLFMYYYREEMRVIVDCCLSCYSRVVPNSRFARNILMRLRVVKKRAIILWTAVAGNAVAYVIQPLFKSGRHYPEDRFVLYALRPMYVSPKYEINLIVQSFAVLFSCLLQVTVTVFFILVTGFIEAQTLALGEELINLWDDAVEHYKGNANIETRIINIEEERKVTNAYVKKNLEDIVRIHITNLNLFRQVEYIFRKPIVIEFTLVIIALTAEFLGGLEDTWLLVPFTLQMVGIDCLIGQKVIDASMTFEDAVYNSKWEYFDATNRKIVLLMLRKAQKTMKLSAGGITTLSFESFMSVIKFIYSAYTTLCSTVK